MFDAVDLCPHQVLTGALRHEPQSPIGAASADGPGFTCRIDDNQRDTDQRR
jgi:hypothetical protein